jgi:hypothetical protein
MEVHYDRHSQQEQTFIEANSRGLFLSAALHRDSIAFCILAYHRFFLAELSSLELARGEAFMGRVKQLQQADSG